MYSDEGNLEHGFISNKSKMAMERPRPTCVGSRWNNHEAGISVLYLFKILSDEFMWDV
jgi:hypothetical protein